MQSDEVGSSMQVCSASKVEEIVSRDEVRDEQVFAEQEESGSAKEVRVVGSDELPLKAEVQASELGSSKQAVTVSRVAEMSLQVLVEQEDVVDSLPRDIGRLDDVLRMQKAVSEQINFNMRLSFINQDII